MNIEHYKEEGEAKYYGVFVRDGDDLRCTQVELDYADHQEKKQTVNPVGLFVDKHEADSVAAEFQTQDPKKEFYVRLVKLTLLN